MRSERTAARRARRYGRLCSQRAAFDPEQGRFKSESRSKGVQIRNERYSFQLCSATVNFQCSSRRCGARRARVGRPGRGCSAADQQFDIAEEFSVTTPARRLVKAKAIPDAGPRRSGPASGGRRHLRRRGFAYSLTRSGFPPLANRPRFVGASTGRRNAPRIGRSGGRILTHLPEAPLRTSMPGPRPARERATGRRSEERAPLPPA